jgi:hypothetical protein
MTPSAVSIRRFHIEQVQWFTGRACQIPGVRRIALIGSLATAKQNPKDADLLVWIDSGMDLKPLAAAARQLKGRAQSRNSNADIFLAGPTGEYFGRICHYRDCRPGVRMSCRAAHCGIRPHLCDDLHVLDLLPHVIHAPPVDLWPRPTIHTPVPQDIQQLVLAIELNQPTTPPTPPRAGGQRPSPRPRSEGRKE